MRKGFTALGLLVLLSACGDPDQNGGGGDDAGAGGAGGTTSAATGGAAGSGPVMGSGGAAPVCNDVVLAAPAVNLTYDPGTPPAAEGGKIADGTYFLTEERMYSAPSGPDVPFGRVQVVVADRKWQEVDGEPTPDDVNPDRRSTSTMAITGTTLTLTRSCPSQGQGEQAEFTATSDGFILYVTDHGTKFSSTFTKQ